MARTSVNLGLIIPEQTDYYDVGVHETNYETLDEIVGGNRTNISNLQQRATTHLDNLTMFKAIFAGDITLTDNAIITLSEDITGYRDISFITGQGLTESFAAFPITSSTANGLVLNDTFNGVGVVNGVISRVALQVVANNQLKVLVGNNVRLRALRVRNKYLGGV